MPRPARPAREYSDDDRALFAKYVANRADVRPKACVEGAMCWVECGPVALKGVVCRGCGSEVGREGVFRSRSSITNRPYPR